MSNYIYAVEIRAKLLLPAAAFVEEAPSVEEPSHLLLPYREHADRGVYRYQHNKLLKHSVEHCL